MDIPKIGTVPNLPAKDYHAHPATGSSTLKNYLKFPTAAHARDAIENPKEAGDAALRGTVTHTLLLEPHRLDLDYVIEREKLHDKTRLIKNGGSKEDWDAMKKRADELLLPIVDHKTWREANGMADSVKAHKQWKKLGKGAEFELSVFGQINGHPVKARYDAVKNGVILDVKTCRFPLTDAKIMQVIASEKYHLSAAMYLEVGKSIGLDVDTFNWVFVESFRPYLCRFFEAKPKMLEVGLEEFYYALEKHGQCKKDKKWPGYTEEITEIDLPDWYESREAWMYEETEGTI